MKKSRAPQTSDPVLEELREFRTAQKALNDRLCNACAKIKCRLDTSSQLEAQRENANSQLVDTSQTTYECRLFRIQQHHQRETVLSKMEATEVALKHGIQNVFNNMKNDEEYAARRLQTLKEHVGWFCKQLDPYPYVASDTWVKYPEGEHYEVMSVRAPPLTFQAKIHSHVKGLAW